MFPHALFVNFFSPVAFTEAKSFSFSAIPFTPLLLFLGDFS